MKKTREKLGEVGLVGLGGILLLAIVLFSPNGGDPAIGSFFKAAQATNWGKFLEWPGAWCSLKIILCSASLLLLIDSLGTLLLILNHRRMAAKVFILTLLPFLGFFIGTYYLLKSVF